jgi:hypothetical protein
MPAGRRVRAIARTSQLEVEVGGGSRRTRTVAGRATAARGPDRRPRCRAEEAADETAESTCCLLRWWWRRHRWRRRWRCGLQCCLGRSSGRDDGRRRRWCWCWCIVLHDPETHSTLSSRAAPLLDLLMLPAASLGVSVVFRRHGTVALQLPQMRSIGSVFIVFTAPAAVFRVFSAVFRVFRDPSATTTSPENGLETVVTLVRRGG